VKEAEARDVIPAHYRGRQGRVEPSGVITLRHNSWLHHIGLGRKACRHPGLDPCSGLGRAGVEDGELLRGLTLDPSRDYQRQNP